MRALTTILSTLFLLVQAIVSVTIGIIVAIFGALVGLLAISPLVFLVILVLFSLSIIF